MGQIITYKEVLYIQLADYCITIYIKIVPEELTTAKNMLMLGTYIAILQYKNPKSTWETEKAFREEIRSLADPERR